MYQLPPELVIRIASLPLDAVQNLRLSSSWLANITVPVFAHTIGVLHTVDCIRDLQYFLADATIAKNIRTLRIYHAVWPKCPRSRWATHPLLSGGERNGTLCWENPDVKNAYHAYNKFVMSQPTAESLKRVFAALPALSCIAIEHVRKWRREKHPKYNRLISKIWMEPHFADAVEATVKTALQALEICGGIKVLRISGKFNPQKIRRCVPLSAISTLILVC